MAKSATSTAWLGLMPTPFTKLSMMAMRVISVMKIQARLATVKQIFHARWLDVARINPVGELEHGVGKKRLPTSSCENCGV